MKRVFGLLFLITLLTGKHTIIAQVDNTTYHVTHNVGSATGPLTIPGNSSQNYIITGTTTTNNRHIIIQRGYEGTIKLQNLNMTCSNSSNSLILVEGATVGRSTTYYNADNMNPLTKMTIVLEGSNTLYYRGSGSGCCIEVMQGAQVHFRSIDENDNSKGLLTAKILPTGTSTSGGSTGGGAAIGSRIYSNAYNTAGTTEGEDALYTPSGPVAGREIVPTAGGNVIISSGTIVAQGGHGAGIGGGFRHYYNGMIVIYGGNVTSKAYYHGAGIGSGCPEGTGVMSPDNPNHGPGSTNPRYYETYYTSKSAILVLPPAEIEGAGAGVTSGIEVPILALAGTKTKVYVNDPKKPELTIHTQDYEPNADIYVDLTSVPEITDIFTALDIPYPINAAKFGTTNAEGKLILNAQVDQEITFFTDKSSSGVHPSYPNMQGRPYLPKDVTIPSGNNNDKHDIELEFLPVDIFMEIFEATSKPLVQGYTVAEAVEKAYHLKILYKDTNPMTSVNYELEDGNAFDDLIFLAADSSTIISAPQNLTNGMTFYIIVPLKHGMLVANYLDVLAISGFWKGINTGKIRKVPEQRVVLDDTNDNNHIKVTANPNQGAIATPASYTVTLNLNINHTGLAISFNKDDIQARYLVTTEPDYDAAVAAVPVNQWPFLNTPQNNAENVTTTVSFADKTSGTYYIHWFVISGPIYAHSKTVIGPPPATYGGFGPYCIVGLNDDLATTFEYSSVGIDILDNDVLQQATLNGVSSALSLVTEQPKAGILSANGHQIIYKHTNAAVLTNDVDSFAYKISVDGTDITAKVYVYVIRSSNGSFAACKGTPTYPIALLGSDVDFTWYDTNSNQIHTGATYTLNNVQSDVQLGVAPKRSANPYKNLPFPVALLTVKVVDAEGSATMRWTGAIDTCWHNPGNWVQVTLTGEIPVSWLPNGCTDVIISSDAANYPMLVKAGECQNIEMKDRAMLAGIHYLTYANATVEFKLNPSEKDRFIMWSAPLKSMYSGDYHYKTGGNPTWGDVYMNLFQHKNPADNTSVAAVNNFTATFGELGEILPLGKAFNLRVTATTENYGKTFTFPQTSTSYTDANNNTYNNLTRTNGSKFIVDKTQLLTNGTFDMAVANDIAGSYLVQIVNPYMGYLDIEKFLADNTSVASGYAIWNGNVKESFIQELTGPYGAGNRYRIITQTIPAQTKGLIPPLQSFFVTKKNTAKLNTVKMSPEWTTTVGATPYEFRSATEESEKNILRIQAMQGDKKSYAILHNDPSASTTYSPDEDMYKIFYDEILLEVYSFASANEALAINSRGDFSEEIKLGVRVKEEGEVSLNFQSVTGFNHRVYLIDNELKGKDKEIDLQKISSYTFMVTKSSGNGEFAEINDRFSLRFEYNPVGNEELSSDNKLQVTQQDDQLLIQSLSGMISALHIYTIDGMLVYSSTTLSDLFKVTLPKQQTYIVKAAIDDKEFVQKTIMK